jgi:Bromodomain extra-terminal - transcription regulation
MEEGNVHTMAAAILHLQSTVLDLLQRVQHLEHALADAGGAPTSAPVQVPRTILYPPATGTSLSVASPSRSTEVSYAKKLWLKKKLNTIEPTAMRRVVALLKQDGLSVGADEVELDLDLDKLSDATLRKIVSIVSAAPAPLKRMRL